MKYWNRLCADEIPKLLQEAVLVSKSMQQAGRNCWVTRVKEMFGKAGSAS